MKETKEWLKKRYAEITQQVKDICSVVDYGTIPTQKELQDMKELLGEFRGEMKSIVMTTVILRKDCLLSKKEVEEILTPRLEKTLDEVMESPEKSEKKDSLGQHLDNLLDEAEKNPIPGIRL